MKLTNVIQMLRPFLPTWISKALPFFGKTEKFWQECGQGGKSLMIL
jgi:hypothetical protein